MSDELVCVMKNTSSCFTEIMSLLLSTGIQINETPVLSVIREVRNGAGLKVVTDDNPQRDFDPNEFHRVRQTILASSHKCKIRIFNYLYDKYIRLMRSYKSDMDYYAVFIEGIRYGYLDVSDDELKFPAEKYIRWINNLRKLKLEMC